MKKAGLVIVVLGLVIAAWGFSINETKEEKILLNVLTQILEINHFHPTQVDDDFSKKVFDYYLKNLDGSKMYFLKSDIQNFDKFKFQIDDEIKTSQISFYYAVNETLKKRLEQAEGYCETILSKPFNFDQKESFETDPDKRTYSSNEKELKEYWRQYLKYMTLNSYLNKQEKQEKAVEKGKLTDPDSLLSSTDMEVEAREQVLKNMNERFKRRAEIDEEDNFSFFLNAVSSAFGPHTQYFPPQQKENFDMRMTGTLEGIGAVLQQEEGFTKISSIVTGSACWRQGDLKAGDVVLKVAQGKEEPVDIVDAPMKEVLKLIRGKKGTEVRLTVEKPDGDIVVIPIIRDVVVREETYAKSALIEDEEAQQKFGYINLPSFYSKFGREEGRNSSDDIKSELEMLKEQSVSGVILDLRNNGGGSLQDAIKMAGLFFEQGPVVQVKDRVAPPQSKYDMDKSVTYDGPLVVMINEFSASASEIVAGALKDYDRAVIIGSPSTYGKGTVQTFLDINRFIDPRTVLNQPFGSLKYTVQQFYRVNGSSTQFKGVEPHIVLPDLNDGMEIGEKELDNALPWDSIAPAIYAKWTGMDYGIRDLKEKSSKRIDSDELFQAVKERVEWMKEEQDNTTVSLNAEEAKLKREERKTRNDAFKKLNIKDESISFYSLQEFANEADSIVSRKKEEWQSQLAKDAYIREAMYVLSDMQPIPEMEKVVQDDLR